MKILGAKANDYADPNYLGSKFRAKRFLFFQEKIRSLPKPIRILDIGGTVAFWVLQNCQNRNDLDITVLNLEVKEDSYPNIKPVVGNALDLSCYKDGEFDVVFSNSVIEHLYTKEHQKKMAQEAVRVGKHYFIQTPNRHFPIEPHYKFPLFQYLPRGLQLYLMTKTKLINGITYPRRYSEEMLKEIRLLTKLEFMRLFPNSKLFIERFFGLPKSFIVHNFE